MPGKMLTKFRNRLLRRRREILEQVSHTESDLKALEYRDIEIVDEAQREGLIRMLNLLDERGRAEIKEINDALDRMTAGTYGTCELCRGQNVCRLCRQPACAANAFRSTRKLKKSSNAIEMRLLMPSISKRFKIWTMINYR